MDRLLFRCKDFFFKKIVFYTNFRENSFLALLIHCDIELIQDAKEIYYFFDEIQIIDGWEHFARRMADQKKHVYITGSNAKMLSSEMKKVLGGRYLSKMIMPFSLSSLDENFIVKK